MLGPCSHASFPNSCDQLSEALQIQLEIQTHPNKFSPVSFTQLQRVEFIPLFSNFDLVLGKILSNLCPSYSFIFFFCFHGWCFRLSPISGTHLVRLLLVSHRCSLFSTFCYSTKMVFAYKIGLHI